MWVGPLGHRDSSLLVIAHPGRDDRPPLANEPPDPAGTGEDLPRSTLACVASSAAPPASSAATGSPSAALQMPKAPSGRRLQAPPALQLARSATTHQPDAALGRAQHSPRQLLDAQLDPPAVRHAGSTPRRTTASRICRSTKGSLLVTLASTTPSHAPAAPPRSLLGDRRWLLDCHCASPVVELLRGQGWDVISDPYANVHCSSPDKRGYVEFLPETEEVARGELRHIQVKDTDGNAAWCRTFGPGVRPRPWLVSSRHSSPSPTAAAPEPAHRRPLLSPT